MPRMRGSQTLARAKRPPKQRTICASPWLHESKAVSAGKENMSITTAQPCTSLGASLPRQLHLRRRPLARTTTTALADEPSVALL